jgi:hypothetical protein
MKERALGLEHDIVKSPPEYSSKIYEDGNHIRSTEYHQARFENKADIKIGLLEQLVPLTAIHRPAGSYLLICQTIKQLQDDFAFSRRQCWRRI